MNSNLPPGCTHKMIEDHYGVGDLPPECEDCPHFDEELELCPYTDHMEFCCHISKVSECRHCKKPMSIVKGLVPRNCTACFYEEYYCCSPECAQALQEEIQEEIDDRMRI